MRPIPLYVLLSTVLLVGFSTTIDVSNLHSPILKGKIKTVHLAQYAVKTSSKGHLFDLNYEEYLSYDTAGKLTSRIEESCFWWSYKRTRCLYDQSKLIQLLTYDANDQLILDNRRFYDQRGRLVIDRFSYEKDSTSNNMYTYRYDEFGNQLERAHYDSKDSLDYKYIGQFDAAGNETEIHYFDHGLQLQERQLIQYDDRGHPLEKSTYDPIFGLKTIEFFDHNQKGMVTHYMVYDGSGKLMTKSTSKYDHSGNLLDSETSWASANPVVITCQYKIDRLGNVIQQNTFDQDGGLIEVLEREIVYY